MKTAVTELFDIAYPIVLSGMSWISIPSMAAAVSNAGGLGILATGALSTEETRKAIQEVRQLTDKPFGANATLLFPGARENAKVLLEEKVPVINYSLGKGDWIARESHRYGGKVIATVVNERHALRAQEQGADALIVTGHEAAAHGGDVASLVLVPTIANNLSIPVIAAGGFADGRGLAAAIVLGAAGIAMGTRFMSTAESPLHRTYKNLSLEKGSGDTIYGTDFDGLGCRSMHTPAAVRAYRRGLLGLPNLFTAAVNSNRIAKMLNLPYWKLFLGVIASGWKNALTMAYLANAFPAIECATIKGDMAHGVLPVGQATGLIKDIPTVAELMKRIVDEAQTSLIRLRESLV
ncbi:MAG: nitronate monooxygenase [Deltaproteobacteria bacterium]|nr:nitronate monooxygenase [Deltaproteobacteria bacterium]